ncbi:MAG TPA: APC family permease [Dehalococcoidia bacterium]|nr:APC family permease [Dehalococcoidia bacterium]
MEGKERGRSFIRRDRPRVDGASEPRRDEKPEEKKDVPRDRVAAPPTEHRAGKRIVIPRQERGETRRSELDIELREVRRGMKPGDTYLRVVPGQRRFTKVQQGYIEATRLGSRPPAGFDRILHIIKGMVLGSPFATSQVIHERLTKVKALAIFSSDALSSSAYATEEILIILLLAGSGALHNSLWIAGLIALLLGIVTISYRQTIKAYPSGGGAYIVAHENLGRGPGLVAGSALLVDYVLTVSVSVAAGVAAVTSAAPDLHDVRVPIGVVMIVLITLGNLRGIREAGTLFAIPTYFFLLSMSTVIVVGFVKVIIGDAPGSLLHEAPPREQVVATSGLTLFLLMRAFSSGSAALTGIEAISNGVPAFQRPEVKNARTTMVWMAVLLAFLFLSITFLSSRFGLVPEEPEVGGETIVSQLGKATVGTNVFYYAYQVGTALVLFLAANTSFNGFPPLGAILARDRFLPRQFAFRGDRLAYSNGIMILAVAAAVLLAAFGGEVTRLIPLYALGVFVSFTLSQAGMVKHTWRLKEVGWKGAALISGVGAAATAIVAVVIGISKFASGAWISVLMMLVLMLMFALIRRHYDWFAQCIAVDEDAPPVGVPTAVPIVRAGDRDQAEYMPPRDHVIVPVDGINKISLGAIGAARELSRMVTAVHLTDNRESAEEFRERWQRAVPDVPLQIIESPYRQFVAPMIEYLHLLAETEPQRVVVVLPSFVARHWWERLLHNRDVLRLRPFLSEDHHVRLIDFPYKLTEDDRATRPGPGPGPDQTGS